MDLDRLSMRSTEFKQIFKHILKDEIQFLLQRLSEVGEESVVITTSATEGVTGHLASSVGQEFVQKDSQALSDIQKNFQAHCKASASKSFPTAAHHAVTPGRYEPSKPHQYHREPAPTLPVLAPQGSKALPVVAPQGSKDRADENLLSRKSTGSVPSVHQSVRAQEKQGLPVFEKAFGEKQMKLLQPSGLHTVDCSNNSLTKVKTSTCTDLKSPQKSVSDSLLPCQSNSSSLEKTVSHNDDQSKMLWMDYIQADQAPAKPKLPNRDPLINASSVSRPRVAEGRKLLDTVGMKVPHTISNNKPLDDTEVINIDIVHAALAQSLEESDKIEFETELKSERDAKLTSQCEKDAAVPLVREVPVSGERSSRSVVTSLDPVAGSSMETEMGEQVSHGVEQQSAVVDLTGDSLDTKENILPVPSDSVLTDLLPHSSHPITASMAVHPNHSVGSDTTISTSAQGQQPFLPDVSPFNLSPSPSHKNFSFRSSPTKSKLDRSVPGTHCELETQGGSPGISLERTFELLGTKARCLLCDKLVLRRNRKYHWLFHTGQKPHKCDICGKQFAHPSNLKTHLITHKHITSVLDSSGVQALMEAADV